MELNGVLDQIDPVELAVIAQQHAEQVVSPWSADDALTVVSGGYARDAPGVEDRDHVGAHPVTGQIDH